MANQIMSMPGRSFKGALPPLTSEEQNLSARLRKHVEELAGNVGERNSSKFEQLNKAADYIKKTLDETGYTTAVLEFEVDGKKYKNIEARMPDSSKTETNGEKKQASDGIVVFGAHYDTVTGCPGANDNGTGVAAVLEMARLISKQERESNPRNSQTGKKEFIFVFFPNEEPPYFGSKSMGSYHYAEHCKAKSENITGMISVETIGYYSDQKGSQQYPAPFSFFYPDSGNFIAFVGNMESRPFLIDCIKNFRAETSFPTEGMTAPDIVKGVGWSDQRNFWKVGYPGLMVTDTAPYRYPDYHKPSDTPDKVDYDKASRVVLGLTRLATKL